MTFQKGHKLGFKPGNKLGGRTKGSINFKKKVEWTVELMEECLGIDGKTGRKLTPKTIKKKFSAMLWNNPKMIMDFLDRKLGKPVQRVAVEPTSYLISGKEPEQVEDAQVIDGYEITDGKGK